MNKEHGYTLIETLVAITLVLILSATGLYGWRSWQQSQRLSQVASDLYHYLIYLRNDANWHNLDRHLRENTEGEQWCLVADDTLLFGCPSGNPLVFRPSWQEVKLHKITPKLAFYGLQNTAWAGNISLESDAGIWTVVVSHWGRVRLCEGATC